ncbi:unnamed protein product [Prorocentrum cordatum]|uniref:Uncharacterized protein n=1 Tax=Prorocentrum cordatum TaxID=2364126 RepID=A0ABN9QHF9_9DINO|nr:unnamed protein product [Polarella glacialis]
MATVRQLSSQARLSLALEASCRGFPFDLRVRRSQVSHEDVAMLATSGVPGEEAQKKRGNRHPINIMTRPVVRWGAQLWNWELDGALRDKRGLPPPAAGLMRAVVVLLPLLDEVTRRELRIDSAMQNGDQAEAKKLLAGKSDRHLAYEAYLGVLRIEGEGSQKAAECFEIYKSLGAGIDVTAEDEGL